MASLSIADRGNAAFLTAADRKYQRSRPSRTIPFRYDFEAPIELRGVDILGGLLGCSAEIIGTSWRTYTIDSISIHGWGGGESLKHASIELDRDNRGLEGALYQHLLAHLNEDGAVILRALEIEIANAD